MDWASLSRLVPEIALVVIFVWFTLERDKRSQNADALRESADRISNDRRDEMWRDFLKEERASRSEFSKRIAEEVKANTLVLSAMNTTLIAHDTRTTAALAEIMPSLHRIENGLALAAEADGRS